MSHNRKLAVFPARVVVDHNELEQAVKDYVVDAMIYMHGKKIETGRILTITVEDLNVDTVRVEIAEVVLLPEGAARVMLRTSNLWPLDDDPDRQTSSTYFVCDKTEQGWSTRQMKYYYGDDDRGFVWSDLPALDSRPSTVLRQA